MDIDPYVLKIGAIRFIIVVCSLALHEWGHAYVADRLGDPTPRNEGRVTLNPMAHIDIIGTIVIPLMGALGMFGKFAMIGWAKPVYTNPSYFRRGYFDQALVTLAGPGMNIALAIAGTAGAIICARLGLPVARLFGYVIEINVALAVFNMLPIPPLDGSKFLMYLGAMSEETYMRISMFGSFLLLILINIPACRMFMGLLMDRALIPFAAAIEAFT
jgi:Zn-dependent protease